MGTLTAARIRASLERDRHAVERFILDAAKKYAPENDKAQTDLIFADFLLSQFGVQTMASFRNFHGEGEEDENVLDNKE